MHKCIRISTPEHLHPKFKCTKHNVINCTSENIIIIHSLRGFGLDSFSTRTTETLLHFILDFVLDSETSMFPSLRSVPSTLRDCSGCDLGSCLILEILFPC